LDKAKAAGDALKKWLPWAGVAGLAVWAFKGQQKGRR
jgi:hypothetical protein